MYNATHDFSSVNDNNKVFTDNTDLDESARKEQSHLKSAYAAFQLSNYSQLFLHVKWSLPMLNMEYSTVGNLAL